MITINDIRNQITACEKCLLHSTRTHAVPGHGCENASIVFVGEAPGRKEDEQGMPFVGKSGSILSEHLNQIGLNREDVFITNVVKCRPPNNRDPEKQEVSACKPYLVQQIEIINPQIIVPLGRYALRHFVDRAPKISKIHGQTIETAEWTIFPLYHPAATIYNRGLIETMKNDFDLLQKIIDKKTTN